MGLCSSAPWVPFYPYTTFQNPMSRASSKKSRKTIITQKVLATQSSKIVHCDQHTHKPVRVKADQISSWPHIVPLLTIRCLYCGVHLSGGQSDQEADQISSWHYVVPLLTTRCLYQGGTSDWRSAWPKGWPNVKLTLNVKGFMINVLLVQWVINIFQN